MKVRVIQPTYIGACFHPIGTVLELDCSYATMPRWAVEYLPAPACSGAPDIYQPFGRKSRYGPPRPSEKAHASEK